MEILYTWEKGKEKEATRLSKCVLRIAQEKIDKYIGLPTQI